MRRIVVPGLEKKHRVIGILHVLRKLKDAGFVDEESRYAKEAVKNVQDEILKKAITWYKVGARRGALEVLGAILDDRLAVRRKADGTKEIVASVDAIKWKKRLNITVGSSRSLVPSHTYKLAVEDLDFE